MLAGCENIRWEGADEPGTSSRLTARFSISVLFWKAPVSNKLIVGGGGVCVSLIPPAGAPLALPRGENPPDFLGV